MTTEITKHALDADAARRIEEGAARSAAYSTMFAYAGGRIAVDEWHAIDIARFAIAVVASCVASRTLLAAAAEQPNASKQARDSFAAAVENTAEYAGCARKIRDRLAAEWPRVSDAAGMRRQQVIVDLDTVIAEASR